MAEVEVEAEEDRVGEDIGASILRVVSSPFPAPVSNSRRRPRVVRIVVGGDG